MARSIHETRRDLEEARRWDVGDRKRHVEFLDEVGDRLGQKRRYKRRADRARESGLKADIPKPVAVVTEPAPPHVHNPLTEDDLRGLLALLPGDIRPLVS